MRMLEFDARVRLPEGLEGGPETDLEGDRFWTQLVFEGRPGFTMGRVERVARTADSFGRTLEVRIVVPQPRGLEDLIEPGTEFRLCHEGRAQGQGEILSRPRHRPARTRPARSGDRSPRV